MHVILTLFLCSSMLFSFGRILGKMVYGTSSHTSESDSREGSLSSSFPHNITHGLMVCSNCFTCAHLFFFPKKEFSSLSAGRGILSYHLILYYLWLHKYWLTWTLLNSLFGAKRPEDIRAGATLSRESGVGWGGSGGGMRHSSAAATV